MTKKIKQLYQTEEINKRIQWPTLKDTTAIFRHKHTQFRMWSTGYLSSICYLIDFPF